MKCTTEQSMALLIDVQDRLVPALHKGEKMVRQCAKLIQGLNTIGVPILVARQYPKGLGDTVAELREVLRVHEPLDKLSFSVCGEEENNKAIRETGRNTILIFGAEAHVCVLQTVLDLISQGYRVVLVCDCISSRSSYDMEMALRRAKQEGARLSTMEAVLFELLQRAGSDQFKAVSKLVK